MKVEMINNVFTVLLCIFLLLFGLFSVTNITVEWGRPVMGYSALIAGIVGLIVCIKRQPPPPV